MAELILSHLPKTGGTWARFVLKNLINKTTGSVYDIHTVYGKTESSTIIGFVRNPWSWYVSLYNFNKWRLLSSSMHAFNSYGPEFWYLHPGSIRRLPKFEDFIRVYAAPHIHTNISLNFESMPRWADAKTPLLETLYGDYIVPCDHVGKTENLRCDLKTILLTLDTLTPDLEERINTSKTQNTAKKPTDYRTLYTDETAELVFNTHQRIITTHDYSF